MTRPQETEGSREEHASHQRPRGAGWRRVWVLSLVAFGVAGAVYVAGKFLWPQTDWARGGREVENRSLSGDSEDRCVAKAMPREPPASPDEPAAEATPERLREEATEVARRTIQDFPNRPEAVVLLAMVHARFGNSVEAVKCWKRCLDLDPRFAAAYDSMGRLALYKGDYAEAAENLEKALKLAPDVSEIRPLLADALMALGRNEEARAVLEKDAEASRTPEVLFRLGKAAFQLQEYETAKENFEAAIQIDPDFVVAYYPLSSVCARLRLFDEVKKYRDKYQALKAAQKGVSEGRRQALYRAERLPEFLASICYAAGAVYSRMGNLREAKRLWTKAATANPKDVGSRHQLVLAYLQENRLEEARHLLWQMRGIEPEEPVHCLNLGFLDARLGNFEAAKDAFTMACKLAPQQSAAHAALAQLYLQTNRLAEARQAAQAAVDLEPSASNYSVLGAACARIGDAQAAMAAIDKAMKLEPHNPHYARLYEQIQHAR